MMHEERYQEPKAIASKDQYYRLAASQFDDDRKLIAAHDLALEESPSSALGPDLNNFYTILAPNTVNGFYKLWMAVLSMNVRRKLLKIVKKF